MGSAIPESYKLVLPFGNGMPLSDVYIINVSFMTPASSSSFKTRPTPVKSVNNKKKIDHYKV